MTKLFKVVSNNRVRVRRSPQIIASNIVRNRLLVRDDILEVREGSRTESSGWVWWEHVNSPGFWSATESINGGRILMVEHKPEHKVVTPAPPDTDAGTTQPAPLPDISDTPITPRPISHSKQQIFEVLGYMNVRNKPALGNTLIAGEQLTPGMRLAFTNHTSAGGFEWWEQVNKPGHWTAAGTSSGGRTFMRPVESVSSDDTHMMTVPWITQIQSGINFKNDCGHTCVLMVLRFMGKASGRSVKDLYDLRDFRHSQGWTTGDQLVKIGNHFGGNFARHATRTATMESMTWLKNTLRKNKPVIVLVWYPSLGFNNPSNGMFNHWIVVTGFQGSTFYVNDPLWVAENRGAERAVSQRRLLASFQTTNSTNKFVVVASD